ncbi:nuclear transport factor 2 family protein [Aspergillus undulatus]|uniref:nuclear transport factor 2 family protein n=1 Tax=Aspergillus undulatus TaxID=1810928 RepID=UPI003CCE3A03
MSTPKYTARQVLDAFYDAERIYMSAPPETRDFSGIAATMSPNIRIEQTSALPYAGVYIGPQGVQDWATRMAEHYDIVDVQDPEIFERAGSDRVAVLSNLHLRVRATGQDLYFPFAQSFTVDLEEGVILEIRSFLWDVAAINKALGHVASS